MNLEQVTERQGLPGSLEIRIEAKAKNAILARLCDECGSIKKAAKEIGVEARTLSSWLNFRNNPSANAIRMFPDRYRRLIPRLEKMTGRSFAEIFPDLPKGVLSYLATKRVAESSVTMNQLTSEVERAKLTYEQDFHADIDRKLLAERMRELLGTLNYRESEILKLRFGLKDGREYELREVAKIFKVTRERVRQLEARAIGKLKQPCSSVRLIEFIET